MKLEGRKLFQEKPAQARCRELKEGVNTDVISPCGDVLCSSSVAAESCVLWFWSKKITSDMRHTLRGETHRSKYIKVVYKIIIIPSRSAVKTGNKNLSILFYSSHFWMKFWFGLIKDRKEVGLKILACTNREKMMEYLLVSNQREEKSHDVTVTFHLSFLCCPAPWGLFQIYTRKRRIIKGWQENK